MTHLVSGELRIRTTITCKVCGIPTFGGLNRIELKEVFYKDVPQTINRHQQTHLVEPPVGWGVFGNGNYHCPKCMKG